MSAVVAAGVLSGFAFLLLTGQYINDGPVVVAVSRNHGVHVGDLFILVGWAVAVLAVLVLAVMPRRTPGSVSAPADEQAGSPH